MATDFNSEGMLIVGHGTREAAGQEEFFRLVERLRSASDRPVEGCCLELARPTIAEGFERLVERGVRRMTVIPLLLFAAGHAKRDIPAAVAEAAARHSGVQTRQSPALECHPQILALSARRFHEALTEVSPADPNETLLLFVGRGSQDSAATDKMHRFAELRAAQTPVGRVRVCFLAMQRPTLAEGLAEAAASGFRRIVVQPHLLFSGMLYDEIRAAVVAQPQITAHRKRARRRADGQQWFVTSVLGPEPELAAAVLELATCGSYVLR